MAQAVVCLCKCCAHSQEECILHCCGANYFIPLLDVLLTSSLCLLTSYMVTVSFLKKKMKSPVVTVNFVFFPLPFKSTFPSQLWVLDMQHASRPTTLMIILLALYIVLTSSNILLPGQLHLPFTVNRWLLFFFFFSLNTVWEMIFILLGCFTGFKVSFICKVTLQMCCEFQCPQRNHTFNWTFCKVD